MLFSVLFPLGRKLWNFANFFLKQMEKFCASRKYAKKDNWILPHKVLRGVSIFLEFTKSLFFNGKVFKAPTIFRSFFKFHIFCCILKNWKNFILLNALFQSFHFNYYLSWGFNLIFFIPYIKNKHKKKLFLIVLTKKYFQTELQ